MRSIIAVKLQGKAPTINQKQLCCYTRAHGTLIPLHKYDDKSQRNGTVRKDGKRPIHKDWTKRDYPAASKVIDICVRDNRNVGVRLPADVVVIDIDPRNGGNEGWDALTMEYGIDESIFPCTITGSGGRHYWARKPADVPVRDTLQDFPGVEFKSKGRQVVAAGSIHPETEEHYRWNDDAPAPDEIPEMPEALLLAITRPQRPAVTSGGQLDQEQAEAVLARLNPRDFDTNEKWLKLMMAIHHATLGDARQEWIDWSISDPEFASEAEHIGRRWDSLHTERGGEAIVTIGTLRHYLAEAKALDVLPPDQDQAAADFEDADDPDFDMTEEPAEPEPMLWDANKANEMLDHAEAQLLMGGASLYQTGGRIVHPVRTDRKSDSDEAIRRPEGALTVQDVSALRLELYMNEKVRFVRAIPNPKKPDKPTVIKYPAPLKLAQQYIARSDKWRLSALTGIIETPTLRSDGTLLTAPGYDTASGLLLDMGGTVFPKIPDRPSHAEALAALAFLVTPFQGFPFEPDGPNGTSASRSVMLAAVLTALVRRTLRAAPCIGVSAPTPGTGKTLAIQVVSLIAMGREATAMSQGASREEDEKRLFSALLQGDLLLTIDNVTRAIGGDALCSIMTERTWQNRILGESRNVSVATNALIMATGNNLAFEGDMTRRAVMCRMDAGIENPERRSFDVNLKSWVPAHRVRLVAAGLTILRAFVCAGRPGLKLLTPFGSFEEWSGLIRGALVWLGEPDPYLTVKHIVADDPVKAQLLEFFKTVHDKMGDQRFTAGSLIKAGMDDPDGNDLTDAIHAVDPKANRVTLGAYLKANQSKIMGGLTLRSKYDTNRKIWEYWIMQR